MNLHRIRATTIAVLTVLVALGAATACGSDSTTATTAAQALSVTDQWVKGAPSGMTAAFGTLTNNSDKEIRVVSASSPAAGRMELHEVVADDTGAMTMRPKQGGLVVPANGSLTLQPGGDHLMLFDLPAAITPGRDITIDLRLSDGSTTTFTAQARDFPGADENYAPGHGDGSAAASTTQPGA